MGSLRSGSRSHAWLEDGKGEPRRPRSRVGVGMRHSAGKRDRVAVIKDERLATDINRDRAVLNLHELFGAWSVRLARVTVAGSQGPVPQFDHVRWFRARHQHSATARLAAPQD